jgi:transcriptional regulator with XRE-family HTH domain
MLDAVQLGNRLRAARERRGLSQQEVAETLNLPRTAITNIESGIREVSTMELTRLADFYHISPASLLEVDIAEDASVVLMRALQQQSNISGEIAQAIEDVRDLCHEGAVLRRILGSEFFDEGLPNYAARISSPGEAIRQGDMVAREERRRLGLGNAPIGNIASLISGQGVWVAACSLPDDMSGMFLGDRDDGLAILINSKHVEVRRRFSYAHEYGHALFDRDEKIRLTQQSNSSELVEKRANAFAAAFLMPASGVEDQLRQLDKGRPSRQAQIVYDVAGDRQSEIEIRPRPGSQAITYQDVAIIAQHFVVSYAAVVWRLKSLGHLGPSETNVLIEQKDSGKSFMKLLKFQLWDEQEISKDAREQELRSQLAWLGVEAYRREEISQGRLRELAGKLEVSAGDLIELAEVARGE